jgi:uncharacterized membrane protein YfcA
VSVIHGLDIALVGGAALIGGALNAVAGGGSLITFPTLVAVGVPPVIASITNTVALCPGYLGATLAQRRDLEGQGKRAARLIPFAVAGGIGGAVLLIETGEGPFNQVVPFLILMAALTIAAQDKLRGWLVTGVHQKHVEALAIAPVAAAAVYGGYFGAGLGVMLLAALGVVYADSLVRINALKQLIALVVNVSAAGLFAVWGHVDWPVAGVMAGASLVGGALGGAVGKYIPATVLRWVVVTLGVAVSVAYFVKR